MLFLMASINSSGLPLPAHARSLQPVLGSKSLSPASHISSPPRLRLLGACRDIRTLGVQAGHQGLRQGPGMAEELLGAGLGRRVCAGGGRKTYGMGKDVWLRQGSHLPHAPGMARRAATSPSPGAPEEKRLGPCFPPIPFHESPPPPPLAPVRMQMWPQAPRSPFPRQTQRGHHWLEPVPSSPQGLTPALGLLLSAAAAVASSDAVEESSLRPPQPQKRQHRI